MLNAYVKTTKPLVKDFPNRNFAVMDVAQADRREKRRKPISMLELAHYRPPSPEDLKEILEYLYEREPLITAIMLLEAAAAKGSKIAYKAAVNLIGWLKEPPGSIRKEMVMQTLTVITRELPRDNLAFIADLVTSLIMEVNVNPTSGVNDAETIK